VYSRECGVHKGWPFPITVCFLIIPFSWYSTAVSATSTRYPSTRTSNSLCSPAKSHFFSETCPNVFPCINQARLFRDEQSATLRTQHTNLSSPEPLVRQQKRQDARTRSLIFAAYCRLRRPHFHSLVGRLIRFARVVAKITIRQQVQG